jgi:hypothetical protein
VRKYGYVGYSSGLRQIISQFCPFCLHDESLSWDNCLFTSNQPAMLNHILGHVFLVNDPERVATYICPCFNPGFCQNGSVFTISDLLDHLETVHDLPITKFMQPKKRRTIGGCQSRRYR